MHISCKSMFSFLFFLLQIALTCLSCAASACLPMLRTLVALVCWAAVYLRRSNLVNDFSLTFYLLFLDNNTPGSFPCIHILILWCHLFLFMRLLRISVLWNSNLHISSFLWERPKQGWLVSQVPGVLRKGFSSITLLFILKITGRDGEGMRILQ